MIGSNWKLAEKPDRGVKEDGRPRYGSNGIRESESNKKSAIHPQEYKHTEQGLPRFVIYPSMCRRGAKELMLCARA